MEHKNFKLKIYISLVYNAIQIFSVLLNVCLLFMAGHS